ncbi:glycerophosphoryl diester phosphodiesterase membrane domain-containing protein [Streptomyces antimicrobicus]|uniref:Glycerophosphoryl diester phosphodiesterase membrane domain-containing protein n=1 Tax=Streptomyces antimicrobicus TaxID=2883108 RepID=A0ABS8BFM7_9ACTN|nr:hypothetical protein [Streptomyces antimicrobicus]MCB5183331.1 hypothetical protein [Streptomyces antimicrobicus]
MNDSPGWATPGSSPSEGERSGAPDPGAGASGGPTQPPQDSQPQQPGQPQQPQQPQQPAQPSGQQPAGSRWSAQQPPPGGGTPQDGVWGRPQPGQDGGAPQQQPGPGWGAYGGQQGAPGQYGGQYGQYGYGPYGGGPGGWGAPAAAKPGVIPLRPLGLGEILDGAVTTMRTHWRSVLSITLVVAALVQLVNLLAQKYVFSTMELAAGAEPSLEDAVSSLSVSVISGFIQLVGGLVVTAMLTMIFSKAVLGQSSTVAGAWRDARGQLLRLAGLTLLLAVGALVALLVLLLPGILVGSVGLAVLGGLAGVLLVVWLWIKFSLASPALMLERSGVFRAFARSSKLVQGSWWRIFGITVLTGLITGIVSAMIVGPATVLALVLDGGASDLAQGPILTSWSALIVTAVASVIALTITMPISAGVTVLLYIDQRIRREALDLELARAAGIENYGSTAHGASPGSGG